MTESWRYNHCIRHGGITLTIYVYYFTLTFSSIWFGSFNVLAAAIDTVFECILLDDQE